MKNNVVDKKGFTLIELLAVIVILGILMLIAIPAVSRFIEQSKQKSYLVSIQMAVDSVKNSVLAEEDGYDVPAGGELEVPFSNIKVEKGDLSNINGIVKVTKESDNYNYSVITYGNYNDNDGYCLNEFADVNSLDVDLLSKCQSNTNAKKEIKKGDIVKINGLSTNWYVLEDSPANQDYVVAIHKTYLTSTYLTADYAFRNNSGTLSTYVPFYWNENCHIKSSTSYYYYGQDGPYSSKVETGCLGAYSTSKIKEFLENVYIKTIDPSGIYLKSVPLNKEGDSNSYKIRLITKSEFEDIVNGSDYSSKWTGVINSSNIWTMTSSGTTKVYKATTSNAVSEILPDTSSIRVKPVINIRKTAIESHTSR